MHAPGVVQVLHYQLSALVGNAYHITLDIGDVVVGSAVVGNCQRQTGRIVAKPQRDKGTVLLSPLLIKYVFQQFSLILRLID